MVTLRCTQRLLKQLTVPRGVEVEPPTTRLGDWYANLLYLRPKRLVLCMSEKSLLPVLVPAKGLDTLPVRLRDAVREMLLAIEVPAAAVEAEVRAMEPLVYAPTTSRVILGSMSDFTQMLEAYMAFTPQLTLLAYQKSLSEAPCKPIGMRSPQAMARELLADPIGQER